MNSKTKIERIGNIELGVFVPNDVGADDEKYLEYIGKSLEKEIATIVHYIIQKSAKESINDEIKIYEYKISINIERATNFERFITEVME